jgi:hypothetical protein
MDDARTEQEQQTFRAWWESHLNPSAPVPAHLGALTAEDWDAARKALGAGSKSLLFGTSTRVLDRIAQRFKRQTSSSGSAPQPNQESSDQAAGGVAMSGDKPKLRIIFGLAELPGQYRTATAEEMEAIQRHMHEAEFWEGVAESRRRPSEPPAS